MAEILFLLWYGGRLGKGFLSFTRYLADAMAFDEFVTLLLIAILCETYNVITAIFPLDEEG